MPKQGEQSTAIYLRLSRDDGIAGSESESISTQRHILLNYAHQHGLSVTAEFCDDGISGTRSDRAGLNALLSGIEEGWIGIVLVKDLSRLSRDYIRTGELIERWFPEHGARLIAVNDGIDTGEASAANDYSPIRAIMDDWYARDVSRKVRTAIYARQSAGLCTMANLPFGYQKAAGKVTVIPEKAETVRAIYKLYEACKSCCEIADLMNRTGVQAPGGGGHWNDVTVRRILTNPAYIGNLHLHTTRKTGYKCSRRVCLAESEAILYPVPPIITDSQYQNVQKLMQQRRHSDAQHHPLSGKLFCGVCGSRMQLSTGRFRCSGKPAGKCCKNPSLRCDLLHKQLIESLSVFFNSEDLAGLSRPIQKIIVGETLLRIILHCHIPNSADDSGSESKGNRLTV